VLGGGRPAGGGGLTLYGLLAAILGTGANTALRPIVHAIIRQPVDFAEEEQHYRIATECHAAPAADVRADPSIFSELDSAFLEDAHRVEVSATVTSNKRRELALEAIVGRFTETEGVIRASWRLNPQAS
jgi:putative Mg2+ transporter-C (MgtC) family protein